MLKVEILPTEVYDDADETFKETKGIVLTIEHSLVSVSKWESKWCVPFLSSREKTLPEILDYIRCMTLTQNVPVEVYSQLSPENFQAIKVYMEAPMSATIITRENKRQSREIVTADLIYYWMVILNIPFQCEKWHFNRLLMLINITSIKQQDPKKLKGKALTRSNTELNAQRRAALGTTG